MQNVQMKTCHQKESKLDGADLKSDLRLSEMELNRIKNNTCGKTAVFWLHYHTVHTAERQREG